MEMLPVRVRLRIPTYRAWTAHKTILIVFLSPFERFMGVLKKYVRNRARPERSISMGHQIEDVIGFCVDFIPGLKKIGLPKSRYEGRLTGKGTLGGGLNNMQGRIFHLRMG